MDPYFLLMELKNLWLNQLNYLQEFLSILKIYQLIHDHDHVHHEEYPNLKLNIVLYNYVKPVLQYPINDIFDILLGNFV